MAIAGVTSSFPIGSGVTILAGTGSPEGIVTASVSTLWLQTDGVRGQTLWRKYSGTGNTGWSLIDDWVLNVLDFGAKCDGVTDDTAAIQAAIDTANALAYGVVYLPAKDANAGYVVTQLRFHPGTHLRGDGHGGNFGGSRGTWLYQKSGTATNILTPNDPNVTSIGVIIEDLGFSAFTNQTSNAGGINLERCVLFKLIRTEVTWTKLYGFRVYGSTATGTIGFGSFISCKTTSIQTGGVDWLLAGGTLDQPDATLFMDCYSNGNNSTFIKFTSEGGGHGAGNTTWYGCRFEGGAGAQTFIDSDSGQASGAFFGCRFEAFGGAATFNLVGGSFAGGFSFYGTIFATSGGALNINDTGAVRSQFFGCGASVGNVGRFTTQLGNALISRTHIFAAGTSFTPNFGEANDFLCPANGNPTIQAPPATNMPASYTSLVCVTVRNTTGGAITTTWNAAWHLAGAWVEPAAGKQRSIWFRYDQTLSVAHEIARSAADITV